MANSGSDVGAIGHLRAFDTQTGKQLWNFDILPSTGPGSEAWPKDKPKVGAGVYSSFALDTETGTLYSPTGNPGPDFVRSYRPGDNLYTSTIVMLDARTGALRDYHQLVKNDFHDTRITFAKCVGRQERSMRRETRAIIRLIRPRRNRSRSRAFVRRQRVG